MNAGVTAARASVPRGGGAPTWWVVFSREFTDLWLGGKGLTLALVYTVVLGLWSYVMVTNTELHLIPPKDMVWEMLEASITVGCFLCLIAAAESISGDRERGALEAMLLTPTSRRQIVLGKLLAVLSLWPALLVVTIPYLAVLAQGTDILLPACAWGGFMGSILVVAIASLGMLISLWSSTVKTSMFVALGAFIFIFMPFALPGHVQSGPMGQTLNLVSPLMATYVFLAKVLVNNRTLMDPVRSVSGLLVWHQMISPILFALITLGLVILASPRLRMETGKVARPRALRKPALGAVAVACLLGSAGMGEAAEAAPGGSSTETLSLEMTIDRTTASVGQGDSIVFRTTLTNHEAEPTRPLTVAMNIINLNARGDVVDPEDWSPQRTQYIDALAPGQAFTQTWRVNAIMDGDYMLYMVAIPKPDRPEDTSRPATSPGMHLTIASRVKLNPRGILLYVIGAPALLGLGMLYLNHRRRRETEFVDSA